MPPIKNRKTGDDPATRPQLAVDVASLGGMYAGKIRMVGTERGVGVRNAGAIGAQAGSVTSPPTAALKTAARCAPAKTPPCAPPASSATAAC
jgi:hypothetical protein